MADTGSIARPYALAAYSQARQEGQFPAWSEMLGLLIKVVSDPMLAGVIAHPKVDKQQLTALVLDVCGDGLSQTGKNFVSVVVDNGRLGLMSAIAEYYEQERARSGGRSQVEVVSAFDLDDAQRETIAKAMERRLGRKVDLEVSVDNALIGGVIIRAGDMVIDASLRGRLEQLGQSLS